MESILCFARVRCWRMVRAMNRAWCRVPLCCAFACGVPTPEQPATQDPRIEVTDWSQVSRFNCGDPCVRHADCGCGEVCDTSEGCGCCVAVPPLVPPTSELRRYVYSGCDAAGTCVAPEHFAQDGRAWVSEIAEHRGLWMTTYRAPRGRELEDSRAQLCILVEPDERCVWEATLEGNASVEAPLPESHGGYECGGRTCNQQPAFFVRFEPGARLRARLVGNACGADGG